MELLKVRQQSGSRSAPARGFVGRQQCRLQRADSTALLVCRFQLHISSCAAAAAAAAFARASILAPHCCLPAGRPRQARPEGGQAEGETKLQGAVLRMMGRPARCCCCGAQRRVHACWCVLRRQGQRPAGRRDASRGAAMATAAMAAAMASHSTWSRDCGMCGVPQLERGLQHAAAPSRQLERPGQHLWSLHNWSSSSSSSPAAAAAEPAATAAIRMPGCTPALAGCRQ